MDGYFFVFYRKHYGRYDVFRSHHNARFERDGRVSLRGSMLGTDETSAQLLIYELTGRQIDQVDLAGQIVMDFGFFSNGALLWVMTMDTSGSVPMSIITTYQPGRQTLGSVREIEEVVYRTLFQASQLRAVGTTYIKTYDYAGSEITSERKLVYGWYMEAVEENVSNP